MATQVIPSLNRTSVNIDNISKSLNKTRDSVNDAQKSVNKLDNLIKTNTQLKSQLYKRSTLLSYRINESRLRQAREDKLEASKVGAPVPNKALSFASKSSGSVLGKLIAFASYLTAGWIVNNIEYWMKIGGEFVNRLQILRRNLGNFGTRVLSVFGKFNTLLSFTLSAITALDFSAFTEGKITEKFDELNKAVEELTLNIQESYEAITTPLDEELRNDDSDADAGDDGSRDGDTSPSSGSYSSQEYQSGDLSGIGSKEQQALLSTIRYAEGTAGPTGYSMFFGDKSGQAKYGDLTQKSVAEVEELVTKFLKDPQSKVGNGQRSAAVGAYQFIDITGLAKSVGMSTDRKFDEAFQDELALKLAAKAGISAETLRREGLSEANIRKLSGRWASFPGNNYGQPTKRINDLQSRYNQELKESETTTSSTNISGYRVTRMGRNISSLSELPPHHNKSNATRTSDGRLVNDFTIFQGNKFLNLPVPSPVTGTVEWAGNSGNGGLWVEISSPEGKVELGHFNSIRVKAGQKVNVGDILGLQGHTGRVIPAGPDGTHIHIQAPDAVIEKYIQMINSGSFSGTKVSSSEINPSPGRNAQSSNIASASRSKIIAIDDSQLPSNGMSQPPSDDGVMTAFADYDEMLRQHQKTNLLTELSYT